MFYAAIFLIPAPAVQFRGAAVSDYLLLMAFVLAILTFAGRGARVTPAFTLALGLYLGACALAATQAVSVPEHLVQAIRVLFAWFAFTWTASRSLMHQRHICIAVLSFLAGGSVSGAAAAAQLRGISVIPSELAVAQGRAAGLAVHPNGQGAVLAIAAAMCVALYLGRAVSGRLRLVCGALGLICAAGLVLSGSITALISLATALFLLMWLRGVRPLALVAGGVITVIAFNALLAFQSGLGGLGPVERLRISLAQTGVQGGRNTLTSRMDTMRFAWEQLTDGITTLVAGRGLDVGSLVTFDGQTATHNVELLIWVQGGMLMLASFTVLVGSAGLNMWRTRQDEWSRVVLVGLVAAITMAQTAPVIPDRHFWLMVGLALALAAQSAQVHRQQHSDPLNGCVAAGDAQSRVKRARV